MSADQVRMMCPNLLCRKVLAVPEACRGKTVRCRNCGTNIRVPQKSTAAPANNDANKGKAA
jgi:hypothetical protein